MPSAEHTVRLLLVDDHSLFRESLGRLLEAEPGFELVGDFGTASAAIAALDRLRPDVVLLDFDLGEESAMQFLEHAGAHGQGSRILLVTAGLSSADTLRALELGASGIFLKHRSPSDLIAAIRKVNAGERWLDPGAVTALVEAASAATRQTGPSLVLTPRESDVLRAVFEGLSNKEIGAKLQISETYVKAILQQLFSKTGVRTRGQLVRVALEQRALGGMDRRT